MRARPHGAIVVSGKLTKRYTRALFDLAAEENATDRVGRDLRNVAGAYKKSAELDTALHAPGVSRDEKERVLEALLKRFLVHRLTRNFALVLLRNGRIGALPSIAEAFDALLDIGAGRVRAQVTAAFELSAAERERLRAALTKALGAKEVALEVSVDPNLLGGVVTRVGNMVLDGSLRHRLNSMREHLLNRP